MIFKFKEVLIGSPNKTPINRNLFDLFKKRENISLCGSKEILLKSFF